ncbi:hypothetical protein [Candidatus Binatus sp.]|jgi:hypothetical protein|uniref:hypothetical protein n=1 Tax=Candidatus Binatus sp. TaxID=2811406 RepID=UPI003C8BB411
MKGGEADSDICKRWGFTPPCYVRKIPRRGAWFPEAQSEEDRIKKIAEVVFSLDDDLTFSLFHVENSTDIERVSLAINSTRSKLDEDIFYIEIKTAELHEIQVDKATAETACTRANDRHWNARIDERGKSERLARVLLQANREPKKLTGAMARVAIEHARADRCHVVVGPDGPCKCET